MKEAETKTGISHGPESRDGISRRQFLKTTGAVAAMGMINGMGAFSGPLFADGFDEYLKYDALGLADLVRRKQVTPQELLESAIARIEAVNPKINAVVTKMYDEARRTIDGGLPDGPFKGVPFLLKDLGASYAGARATSGSRLFANYVPDYDSELVKRYKKAGLVIMGKTNTPEFGLVTTTESVLLGPAKNPWKLDHSTGGSSGGSAASVAARIVPIAHGNDGGGSIRIPSSCCGVFGMKPSRGRMPNGPEAGEVWEGFAINHALSLSVRDSAALLDATSAPEIGAPYGIPAPEKPFLEEVGKDPGKLRIAFFTNAKPIHPDCDAAVKDVAKLCESLGHAVEEKAPELDEETITGAYLLVVMAHTAAMLDQISRLIGKKITPEMVEKWTWILAQGGWKASAADLADTQTVFNAATRTVAGFLTRYDVILTPTLATPPPKLGYLNTMELSFEEMMDRMGKSNPFCPLHNITGLPSMSVPLYWNSQNLPIGVQFTGRYADEAMLYRLAGQLENARPWRKRIPKI
jgi:amidase